MASKPANRIPPRPLETSQKPSPTPARNNATTPHQRTARPRQIRHRPQRRSRTLDPQRMGRQTLTTRPSHTHILAFNPKLQPPETLKFTTLEGSNSPAHPRSKKPGKKNWPPPKSLSGSRL